MSIALLLIDLQIDFHSAGSLAVSGADEDSYRIASLISSSSSKISDIYVTLDTHNPSHIAHATCWKDARGADPSPFTVISHQDVVCGRWVPKDPEQLEYFKFYTAELEKKGRFQLTIWPPHCLLGSQGNEIFPAVYDAIGQWESRTGKEAVVVRKGLNDLTEMYSVFQAEVPLPDDRATQLNTALIDRLKTYDKVIIGGQALSHCVNYSTRDLLDHWEPKAPAGLVLLRDGASPVTGCERQAHEFLSDMQAAGVTICTVTDAVVMITSS